MATLQVHTLKEIASRLQEGDYPLSGTTPLGSTEFHFQQPACYLGVALHSGDLVRPELREVMAVKKEERFREEDPYTHLFIDTFPVRLIARDSRFEYDLNREKESCIYPFEKKKWGMQVWKRPLTNGEKERSQDRFMEFHAVLDLFINFILSNCRTVILFDIHSFCYQRRRQVNWWEDNKPEVNLGTRYILRDQFSEVIELFLKESTRIRINGYNLRAEENALFPGGYLTRKFRVSHPGNVLVMAIEFKKIFMDERTGSLYPEILEMLIEHFISTKERLLRIRM